MPRDACGWNGRWPGQPESARGYTSRRELSLHVDLGQIVGLMCARQGKSAGESQYARIVDLVRTAQHSKAPLQRLADRYAVWFTPLTLAICAGAYLLSGDAERVLAVLVVVRVVSWINNRNRR